MYGMPDCDWSVAVVCGQIFFYNGPNDPFFLSSHINHFNVNQFLIW